MLINKSHFFVAISLLISMSLLTACSSAKRYIPFSDYSPQETNPVYKVGKPYQIDGIWYYPEENYEYEEIGIASWYGPDFHNGITANGEIYDMHLMTAAHRTLPLPSIVRVTNLENGKEVILRVNDRGPFVNNRIIDVSKLAAQKLGFHNSGTTKVKVEILPEASKELKEAMLAGDIDAQYSYTSEENRPEPTEKISAMNEPDPEFVASKDTRYVRQSQGRNNSTQAKNNYSNLYIQIAAFSSKDKADTLSEAISKYGPTKIVTSKVSGSNVYRVRIGPFNNGKEAIDMLDTMRAVGYKDARVVEEVAVTKGW